MKRTAWVFAVLLLGFVGLSVVGAIDPSVNTFPKWRLASGTAGKLGEVTSDNRLMVTSTIAPAAIADTHEPSVNTFPKVRLAGGTSGNLAEVDQYGRVLVTGSDVDVSKNSGAVVGSRNWLNFIEGSNTTLTIADDSANGQIDITITSGDAGDPLTDGDKGDITVSSSGTVWTIDNDVVTFAKMQNIATDRLLGRDTAGSGDPEELTVSGGIEFTGSGGIQTSAFTGDVTKSAGGTATTIANDAVTYAKMQNVSAASRLLGRGSAAGAGDPEEITIGSGLSLSGTTLSASGGCTVPGNDTEIMFNDGGACGSDTLFKWAKTANVLGIGGAASAGTDGNVVLTMYGPGASAVAPTTNITDAAQLFVVDYAATMASFRMVTENGIPHTFGRSYLMGTTTLSSTMVQGILIEQLGNDDSIMQFLSTGDITTGMTSLGPTSMYGEMRKMLPTDGGLQVRGFSEVWTGLYLSAIATTESGIQTASTTTDAVMIFDTGLKSGTSAGDFASTNTIAFGWQRRFNVAPNLMLLDIEGDLTVTGAITVRQAVEATTNGSGAPNALAAFSESFKVLTNEGSTAKNYHTLPTAAVTNGSAPVFTFVVQDADGLRVVANTGDTIRIAAAVSGAAGFCESTTIGDSVTVIPVNATEWFAIAVVGAGWACT